jgi:hypothetical protein
LNKSRILKLLEILHFGRSIEIKTCVKMLLIFIHGGYLWLDRAVAIYIEFIVQITWFPMEGEDPLPLFTNNLNEKSLSERMKDNFDTYRRSQGLNVVIINDECVRFVTQVLNCKLLRKCRKDQVSTGAIETTKKYVEGVQMNWVTF